MKMNKKILTFIYINIFKSKNTVTQFTSLSSSASFTHCKKKRIEVAWSLRWKADQLSSLLDNYWNWMSLVNMDEKKYSNDCEAVSVCLR